MLGTKGAGERKWAAAQKVAKITNWKFEARSSLVKDLGYGTG